MSVQISVSCLDLSPPTIKDPEDNLTEPAVFVAVGLKSNSFSVSQKATNIGSITPVLLPLLLSIGSAPKTIK